MLKRLRLPLLLLSLALAGPAARAQDSGDNGSTENNGDNGTLTPAPGANALGGGQPQPDNSGNAGMETQPGEGATPGTPATVVPPSETTTPTTTTIPSGTLLPQQSALPASTGASPPSGNTPLNEGVFSAPTPITLSLPGGYGTDAQSFTLGSGRFSRPPVLFTVSLSQGYDTNIQSTPDIAARPAVTESVAQPEERRFVRFRNTPLGRRAVFEKFQPPPVEVVLAPAVPAQKALGSAVSSINLGMQIQQASPRTVFTLDAGLGLQDYWANNSVQYNGSLGLNFIHRLTPRATVTASVDVVYQTQPDFSRQNAPTTNTNTPYLNANSKFDFSYAWTPRFSTVTSYGLATNFQQGVPTQDIYVSTFGNQFRYTATPREVVTLELRHVDNFYPSAATNNSSDNLFLVGLDSTISPRVRNTVSIGIEQPTYQMGSAQATPYLESSTSLALPRGGALSWSNFYGLQNNGVGQTTNSYRTGLSLTEPLAAKLSAGLSLAYNHLHSQDLLNALTTSVQDQLQASIQLNYAANPRFTLNLSYSYTDFLTSVPEGDYTRAQVFLGGTYTF